MGRKTEKETLHGDSAGGQRPDRGRRPRGGGGLFAELGMEPEGQTQVAGEFVDRTVGLDAVRADIGMLRTPDGHARVESTRVITPPAIRGEPHPAPANTLGIRREMAKYEDHYRLCFVRGPEGFIIGLAEQLG